jgi:hypothetical protein
VPHTKLGLNAYKVKGPLAIVLLAEIRAEKIGFVGHRPARLFSGYRSMEILMNHGAARTDITTINEFSIAPGVRETISEDGAVLLDIEQGICFSLNPAGLKIWELLKQQRSLDEIVDVLGQQFPIPRSQLLSDAAEFIAALESKDLIRRPANAAATGSWFSWIARIRRGWFSSH